MSQQPTNPTSDPLSVLYGPTSSAYNFESLRYPENLDHEAFNGHYINFYINIQKGSKFYSDSKYNYTPAPGAGGGSYTVLDSDRVSGNGGNVILPGTWFEMNIGKTFHNRLNMAISLYMPDSVGFSHQIQYGTTSVAEFGNSLIKAYNNEKDAAKTRSTASDIIKGFAKRAIQTVGAVVNSELFNIAKGIGGVVGGAINPQLLVLFRGVSFRHFQFDFVFTPRDEIEAASVRNIIKAFRFHAYPEIAFDLGVFYLSPSTFDIEFIHKNKRNTNVSMIKTCVLTSYAVDYSPYGWSCHRDGMPVQTTLSLQFQETEVITKEAVKEGY